MAVKKAKDAAAPKKAAARKSAKADKTGKVKKEQKPPKASPSPSAPSKPAKTVKPLKAQPKPVVDTITLPSKGRIYVKPAIRPTASGGAKKLPTKGTITIVKPKRGRR